MRLTALAHAILIGATTIGLAASDARAQRLEQPGSIAEGGRIATMSAEGTAARCAKPRYRQLRC